MQLLQKHFEKILLTLSLAASAVVVYFLIDSINKSKSLIETAEESPRRRVAEYEKTDPTALQSELEQFQAPIEIDFVDGQHRLVNPFDFDIMPGDRIVKSRDAGVAGLQIQDVRPLATRIAYDETRGSGENSRIYFKIALEASNDLSRRRERSREIKINQTASDHPFILTAVEGPLVSPSALRLEMVSEDGESRIPIALGPENSFTWEKIEGYAADLYHEPTRTKFTDQRVDNRLNIRGDEYEIVSVTPEEVALQSKKGDRVIIPANE